MDGEREGVMGPEGLSIRVLRLDDCPRLVKLDAAITGRTRALWFERKLERALSEADVCISLGAEKDGILVGALLGSVHFGEYGIVETVAVLDTVLVDRKLTGQGVGSAMLEQLLLNLRALRVTKLRTEVAWNELELIAFFNRKGFVPAPRLLLERDIGE